MFGVYKLLKKVVEGIQYMQVAVVELQIVLRSNCGQTDSVRGSSHVACAG